jgi:hypothetical protein
MSSQVSPPKNQDKALWFGGFFIFALVITMAGVLAASALGLPGWGILTAGASAFVVTLTLEMTIYNWFTSSP